MDAAENLEGRKYRDEFERRFAQLNSAKHAIACANGTVAIELILRGLEIGRGDEVILPPYTFIASISAIVFAGATPVFADIHPETYCITAKSVESVITSKTKAILAVQLGGRPCDMEELSKVAEKHGIYLISDAAQAVAGVYRGKGIGSYGIAASFSFQNSKNLTSGEGGAITTNCDKLNEKIRGMLSFKEGHIGIDDNLSEIQAAVLLGGLDLIPEQLKKRTKNAKYLAKLLEPIPYVSAMPLVEENDTHARHLFFIRIHEDKLGGITRDEFTAAMLKKGVPLVTGYFPLYDFPCLTNNYVTKSLGNTINCKPETPVCEYISRHEASWLSPTAMLCEKDAMEYIAKAACEVYEELSKSKGGAE